MLRGHVFSEQAFGVGMFALFINQFLGSNNGIIQSYKNAMQMTNTSNSITVKTGVAVVQGRFIEEHTETTINYSKTDSLYCSLVLEIDLGQTNTTTVLNQLKYKILESESSYPSLTQNDIINQTGNIYQFEIARFQNGASGIVNFTDRRNFLSFDSIYSGIIQNNLESESTTSALSAKQGKVLNENLTKLSDYSTGEILYENNSGSNGDVTLSEDSTNYDYIEILHKSTTGDTRTTRIYAPNGKTVTLVNELVSSNKIERSLKTISISGTSITQQNYGGYSITNTGNITGASTNTYGYMSIFKVVGFKYV